MASNQSSAKATLNSMVSSQIWMFCRGFSQAPCGDRALTAETPKELEQGLIGIETADGNGDLSIRPC